MPYNIINSVNQYQLTVTGFETVAALRESPAANSPTWTGLALAFVGGASTFRDGGFRFYMWDPTNSTADDGYNFIKPTDITAAGRWRIITSSQAAGAGLYSGSGSPEAVVVAAVGSIYTDTATGNLYKKQSGAGNTGWV